MEPPCNVLTKLKSKRKSELDGSGNPGKKQCQDYQSENYLDNPTGLPSPPPSSNAAEEEDSTQATIRNWLLQFLGFSATEKRSALAQLVSLCDIGHIKQLRTAIEPYFQRDFMYLLPKELALEILGYLSAKDLLRVARVSKTWRTLSEDALLWREKCEESGIDYDPATMQPQPSDSATAPAKCPYKRLYLRHRLLELNWRRASAPLGDTRALLGHHNHVITCLQMHGNRVVSGSDDNTLKIWSLDNGGECLHTLQGHTGGVWSCQLSPDGQYIVSGSTDRTVRIWRMETGECRYILTGHTSTVRCMDLKWPVVVSGSRDSTLRSWDVETGQCLQVFQGHLCAVRCVKYDGRRVVSGAYDYSVRVWDAATGHCTHVLAGHGNRVYSLQFDPDRNLVISGSLDTTIRVWDVSGSSGESRHILTGHKSLNSDMQLRGNVLVSGNADMTVKVWDIGTGQCLHTMDGAHKHQSAVTCLQFLKNGLIVSSSDDGTVKLWDSTNGQFVRDLVRLETGGGSGSGAAASGSQTGGGVVWRLKATDTKLICAVGSRSGIEATRLLVLDFDVQVEFE